MRPWAGTRIGPPGAGIGELWLAGPASPVTVGGVTRTLDALAAADREALVGARGMALVGARFPLLVKVIDAADRLSLQVHPDDALARDLYGPEAFGKTEAWLVLDAEPAAELVTGPSPAVDAPALMAAVEAGTAGLEHCQRTPAVAGDAWLLQPGTLHAIGAGTFVYEIEQPSDLTFRISDWGRSNGRPLHPAESLRALRPTLHAQRRGSGFQLDGGVLETAHFRLELPDLASPVTRAPGGRSCEVVTALRGSVRVDGPGWSEVLEPLDTLVVPAAIAGYRLRGSEGALAGIGSLP